MIFRDLPLLFTAPTVFAILVAAFVVSIMVGLIFHEFCHAWMANRLGDPTPRLMGRLTLNPLAHYDPIGTTMILFAGFGWAKPVPVNPNYAKNPKQAMLLIAFAGPASNLVVAAVAGIPLRFGWVPISGNPAIWAANWTVVDLVGLFLSTVLVLNVFLALFNLLPLPPLDGSKVLMGLLPDRLAEQYQRLEPWGPGLLMLLILAPFVTNGAVSVMIVIRPLANFLFDLFLGTPGGLF